MGKTSKHEKYLVLISGAKSVQFLKNLGGWFNDHRRRPSFK